LILFELLSGGTYPFPKYRNPSKADLDQMLRDRRQGPPTLRRLNSAVSPAVESIIQKCLEPDPVRRYQNARELREDLERQRHDLPLKYASEPSLRERARKWRKRHPRLTSLTSALVIAGFVLVGCVAVFSVQMARQTALAYHDQAALAHQSLQDNLRTAQFLFNKRELERDDWNKGTQACEVALKPYQEVLEAAGKSQSWKDLPIVQYLEKGAQQELPSELGELLLLQAYGIKRREAPPGTRSTPSRQQLALAMDLNHRAERLLGEDSQTMWKQRAELARLLGEADEEQKARDKITQTRKRTAQDHYLSAFAFREQGRNRAALFDLEKATLLDPQNYSAWILKGNCEIDLGREAEALASYTAAIARRPELAYPWLNRGIVYLKRRLWLLALDDLNRAVELNPNLAAAYLNRAQAHEGLRNFDAALADVSKVIDSLHAQQPDAYFKRANYLNVLKRRDTFLLRASAVFQGPVPLLAGAATFAGRPLVAAVSAFTAQSLVRDINQDVEDGLAVQPTDSHGWIVRGLTRLQLPEDSQSALAALARFDSVWNPVTLFRVVHRHATLLAAMADFDEALKLNPQSFDALQNKAHVLAARLNRNQEALEVLNEAVQLNPDFVEARSGRGVVLARLGKFEEARADAEQALLMNQEAPILYQVAGIFALTSKKHPEDLDRAFYLLSRALRSGFGWDLLGIDPELQPIKHTPRFKNLVAAAKALYTANLQSARNPSTKAQSN
jgi:tetratricopeptide (TPR) repeat protein